MNRPSLNFSAGPAILPKSVLEEVKAELLDYQGTGMSVMEMSHRSAWFTQIIEESEARFRELLGISEEYAVLFVQGGATTQFSMVPLNLMHDSKQADFIDTGAWSVKAIAEANRYGKARVIASSKDQGFVEIPAVASSDIDPAADYLHITTNNTIFGTASHFEALEIPDSVPVVADMSSDILSRPIEVNRYGLIYAGAQKNMGPAGVTLIIIRKDLLGKAHPLCPLMLDYSTHAKKNSLHNTPPTFAIYLAGKVFKWLQELGGLQEIDRINTQKADLLYTFLDQSDLFYAKVQPPHRSRMNVTFGIREGELEKVFLAEAEQERLFFLKGHRSVGGMRASLYNALPLEAVHGLVAFMKEFERKA